MKTFWPWLRAFLLGAWISFWIEGIRFLWVWAFYKNTHSFLFTQIRAWHFLLLIFCVLIVFYLFFKNKIKQIESSFLSLSGFGGVLKQIYLPPTAEGKTYRWWKTGMNGFLAGAGTFVGPEGGAIESAMGLARKWRSVFLNWSETQRRTDGSVVLGAAFQALFGTPLGAFLFPMELRIGGQGLLVAVAVFASMLVSYFLKLWLGIPTWQGAFREVSIMPFQVSNMSFGIFLAIGAGVLSVGLLLVFKWTRQWFLSQKNPVSIYIGVFGVFALLAFSYTMFFAPTETWIWNQGGFFLKAHAWIWFLFAILSFQLIFAILGSSGILWPIWVLGLSWGVLCSSFGDVSVVFSMMLGSVCFLSAFLGTPWTSVFMVWEWTHQPMALCWAVLVCFLSWWIRKRCCEPIWAIGSDLEFFHIQQGRAQKLLESILASEAMVKDFQTVYEHETLIEVQKKLEISKYPFLVVVDKQNHYEGLLTADAIEWALESSFQKRVKDFFEAKDLVLKLKLKVPSVLENTSLAQATFLFEQTPVLPVLNIDRKALGLLFVHQVRIVYDRALEKRALRFEEVHLKTFFQKKRSFDKNSVLEKEEKS